MHLDGSLLIIGDNKGLISVSRRDGSFLYLLNQPKQVNVDEEKVFSLSLNNRVNCIVRQGRYIWAGYENAHADVYDLYKPQGSPIATVQLQKKEAITSMVVQDGIAYCKVSKLKKSDEAKKPKVPRVLDIIQWSPQAKVQPELVTSHIGKEIILLEEKSTWYGKFITKTSGKPYCYGIYVCFYFNNNLEIWDIEVDKFFLFVFKKFELIFLF